MLRGLWVSLESAMYRQIIPDWQAGPRRFDAPPGYSDIWRIPLGTAAPGTLSSARLPSGRVASPGDRQQAWHAVRDILSRYLGLPVDEPMIEREPSGKPRLVDLPVPLHFNLSHCRDLALLAVSGVQQVGIDVEHEREIGNLMAIAKRALPRSDIDTLTEASPAQRLPMFLDFWTQLEARQKAHGKGIFAAAVAECDVSCVRFRPTPRHAACVCVAMPAREGRLRFFDYKVPA